MVHVSGLQHGLPTRRDRRLRPELREIHMMALRMGLQGHPHTHLALRMGLQGQVHPHVALRMGLQGHTTTSALTMVTVRSLGVATANKQVALMDMTGVRVPMLGRTPSRLRRRGVPLREGIPQSLGLNLILRARVAKGVASPPWPNRDADVVVGSLLHGGACNSQNW